MKTAASASRALTLLAVVLVAATLLMDTAEAHRGRGPPQALNEAIARCVCDGPGDDACISCLNPETDFTDWTEFFTCLSDAGADTSITAACTEPPPRNRGRSS
ncbi:uncharacterized protein LOC123518108 [Portunus trituberculatus]|uniref:uncharacterized protein LOC123518108 n=1 Tax=Portunus trituberculatus TaxID=210409 RepID=UPI001E1CBA57|nr:uncharacterized protein LOC123518108 [Portunus trituberculatus]